MVNLIVVVKAKTIFVEGKDAATVASALASAAETTPDEEGNDRFKIRSYAFKDRTAYLLDLIEETGYRLVSTSVMTGAFHYFLTK